MNIKHKYSTNAAAIILSLQLFSANAALTVDRSRLIYDENGKSVSINVTNRNTREPYLVQGWMEDEQEKKISGPLMVLPPVQRIEAGGKTVVRIQTLPDITKLPGDRESVFWFNLREIPPKSTKSNVLMLAMQTRLKVFWRPSSLHVDPKADTVPGTENLTLTRKNGALIVNNPTPYHFSFVELRGSLTGKGVDSFDPVMVAPKASLPLKRSVAGNTPVLMFVNDYGSQRLLPFLCTGDICRAGKVRLPEGKYESAPTSSNQVSAVEVPEVK